MTVPTLYPGIVNSPATFLTSSINDSVTTIPVNELSYFPSGENLATIGDDDEENPETIKYTGKSGTSGAGNLTGVTRGFQGIAQSWDNATRIRRNFTEYDYDALCDYITNHSHISGEGTLIPEGGLSLSDVTTGDASTTKHGLCPKLSNDATEYLNGIGTWTDAPHRDFLTRQAIINGNFDIWQRGTSLASLTDVTITYLADHWYTYGDKNGGTPPTIAQSRQSVTPGELDGSFYHFRISPNGAGSSYGNSMLYYLSQKIEHGVRYLCGDGKTITISFKARSSIANKKIGVYINQHYGTGGSPSSAEVINGTNWTLTSDWQDYEYTFTTNTLSGKTFGTNNDDFIAPVILFAWGSTYQERVGAESAETWGGSGNIDIAQVQLCAGDIALPFEPNTFNEELIACQRYYQKSYDYGTVPGTNTTSGITSVAVRAYAKTATNGVVAARIQKMRTAPTITGYRRDGGGTGEWRINASSYYDVVFTAGDGSFLASINDAAASFTVGNFYILDGQWTAEAEL